MAYHRFHKDKAAEGSLVINNQGVANLYGKELKNVVTTGVALQAQFTPAFECKSRLSRCLQPRYESE